MIVRLFFLFFLFPIILYCQIIDSELTTSWSINDILDIYTFSNIPDYAGSVNYSVEGYKVKYMTVNENGSLVEASGAIFLPVNTSCPLPILSWQHGTIVEDDAAPSENIDNQYIGVVAASHGYIVLMSDYLGLGSGQGFHNYCHSKTEASSVIDLILSSKDFANSLNIEISNQLFLMGYSQGGHATMAAVREIEESFSESLVITSSCPMAGPYSMSDAQLDMINNIYPNPGYFPYVIFAYQNVYGNLYNNPSEILKPGFDELFEMYNGEYSMSQINQQIWSIAFDIYGIDSDSFTPLDMLNENYYNDFLINDNHPFRLALKDNDLIDFTPNSPLRLIHCNGDLDVSFQNSVLAYQSFQENALEEIDLLDGGNFSHGDCALMSIVAAKLYFDTKAIFCDITIEESLNLNSLFYSVDVLGRKLDKSYLPNLSIEFYDDGSYKKVLRLIN